MLGQAANDVGGGFVADVADERGDRQPGDRVAPQATAISPAIAPAEDRASSQECRASAISVAELIRLPTTSLYRATTWLPAMPIAAPAMPTPTCEVGPWPMSLRTLSYPANSRRPRYDDRDPDPGQVLGPFQAVRIPLEGVRRDNRKPRNTTALIETSDRLWIASPSSPTDRVRTASSSSIRPVPARPRALTPTARLACRRSRVSSRRPGGETPPQDRGGRRSYAPCQDPQNGAAAANSPWPLPPSFHSCHALASGYQVQGRRNADRAATRGARP